MNIPDKAVEALAYHRAERENDKQARRHSEERWETWAQLDDDSREWYAKAYMDKAREDLEVAAPFIAAQALRDAAERVGNEIDAVSEAIPALEGWADELDPQ